MKPNQLIAQLVVYKRGEAYIIGLRVGLFVCRYGENYKDEASAVGDAICMFGVIPQVLGEGDVVK